MKPARIFRPARDTRAGRPEVSYTARVQPLPALVYVHFPWCLEKCPYCDFTSYRTERAGIDHEGYADAVVAELEQRVARLQEQGLAPHLRSVFFGGGTPSLWEPRALGRVLAAVQRAMPPEDGASVEVTAECNPTSLDEDRARALVDQGVHRLSIGIQGLDDARLKFLGRLHDARGGLEALRAAVRAKVPRLSGDLIYGVHGQTAASAAEEAGRLADEGITHVSAYNLTIEQGTRFGELARRGRLPLADEGDMVGGFFAIDEALAARGLGHYEISNYGRPGDESRHNLGYWRGLAYLGLGCAAVGAVPDGDRYVRYRNLPLPDRYQRAMLADGGADLLAPPSVDAVEELDGVARLRERIMLGLRLAEGLDLAAAARDVGAVAWTEDRERTAARLIARGRLVREGDVLRVPRDAWIFADGIAAELFLRAVARVTRTSPNGALVPSRPYLSSRRTTSSSSGVETSMTSTSVTATMRWIVPGVQWKVSPTFITMTLFSSAGPTSRFIVPAWTRNVSSFLLWYCRESACPALMCRIFPTYREVSAQISSWPQGLSTRRMVRVV